MKKIRLLITFVIFSILLTFILNFNQEILNFLININLEQKIYFYTYLLISTIYFFTPLPITIIILINGYIFMENGFYLSIFQLLISSYFLFLFSKKLNNSFRISNYYEKKIKKFNFNRLLENNYSIFISRYLIPYFFHNILFGLTKININKFIIIIFLAELPMIYALNTFGFTLGEITYDTSLSIFSLFKQINFYIPFLIIFIIFILVNFFKKRSN